MRDRAAAKPRAMLALLAIFLVALGVRLAYLDSDPRPQFGGWLEGGLAHNIVDDGRWFQMNERAYDFYSLGYARHLIQPAEVDLRYADAHPLWAPEIVEPVGEAVVLAGLWEITGSQRFLPDQLLRILLDALTALLVYRVALELFKRRRTALLAGGLYAIYPPIAWQTGSPYLDFWGVDLTIAILALQLQAARSSHRWRWLIACGLLVGLGTYFRPFVLVLSALLAVVLNLDAGWRAAMRRMAGVSAIALALVVPWTVRNYDEFHSFIPLRSGLGQTLWEGLGELHNDFGATFGGAGTEAMVRRERPDLVVESPAWDRYLEHKAIGAIEEHPLFYARLLAYRTAEATFQSFSPSWMHRGARSPRKYKGGLIAFAIERPFNMLEVMLEPAVFLLAMLSLGLTWRRWKRSHVVLVTVVLATIVPYIPLLIDHRYVVPAAFAYLIWIALGIDLLASRLRSAARARAARGVRSATTKMSPTLKAANCARSGEVNVARVSEVLLAHRINL